MSAVAVRSSRRLQSVSAASTSLLLVLARDAAGTRSMVAAKGDGEGGCGRCGVLRCVALCCRCLCVLCCLSTHHTKPARPIEHVCFAAPASDACGSLCPCSRCAAAVPCRPADERMIVRGGRANGSVQRSLIPFRPAATATAAVRLQRHNSDNMDGDTCSCWTKMERNGELDESCDSHSQPISRRRHATRLSLFSCTAAVVSLAPVLLSPTTCGVREVGRVSSMHCTRIVSTPTTRCTRPPTTHDGRRPPLPLLAARRAIVLRPLSANLN